MTWRELRTDVVILACAISAGIHGALTPAHLDEGRSAGLAFLASAALLVVLAVALTRRPESAVAHLAAAAVLAGLIGAYALAVTSGLPPIHPHPEPVEGLAVATKAIEAAGLLAAATALRLTRALSLPRLEGTTT